MDTLRVAIVMLVVGMAGCCSTKEQDNPTSARKEPSAVLPSSPTVSATPAPSSPSPPADRPDPTKMLNKKCQRSAQCGEGLVCCLEGDGSGPTCAKRGKCGGGEVCTSDGDCVSGTASKPAKCTGTYFGKRTCI